MQAYKPKFSHKLHEEVVPYNKQLDNEQSNRGMNVGLVSPNTQQNPILRLQSIIGNAAVQRMLKYQVNAIQRKMSSQEVAQRYQTFIQEMEKYGLPVKFMKVVQQNVNFNAITTGLDNFKPTMWGKDDLNLREDTLMKVENMSPLAPAGEASGISTIVHESVHAYLLTQDSKNKAIGSFNQSGEAYYKNAPMEDGGTTNNAKRLFQEAAAEYVSWRITTWWQAFETLSTAASVKVSPDRLTASIDKARQKYNTDMQLRKFGYSEAIIGSQQIETTRPLAAGIKKFLDEELLESKIPDAFDSNPGFQQLITQAQTLVNQPSQKPNP